MTGVVISDKNVNVTVSKFPLGAPVLLLPLLLLLLGLLQQSGKQQVLSHWLNTAVGLNPDNIG